MDKIKATIHDYEYMTAGRFYSKMQSVILFNLVACANLLCENEKNELRDLIFSEEIEEYRTETDCANGILMASLLKSSEYKKEILLSRKQTLEVLLGKKLFNDRESWLKFIHSDKINFSNLFEKAIYLYSMQKADKALSVLKQIAENGHYLSVKLTVALCKELRNVSDEARCLILLNRILEELLYCEVPVEYVERLHEIWDKVSEDIIEDAYNKKLTYFSEDTECGAHIGFN